MYQWNYYHRETITLCIVTTAPFDECSLNFELDSQKSRVTIILLSYLVTHLNSRPEGRVEVTIV